VSQSAELTLEGCPAVLSVPVLQPCLKTEMLLVSVETYTGLYLVHLPQYEPKIAEDMQTCLNSPRDKAEKLDTLLTDLRMWIAAKHLEKSLQHLPVTCYERLPLLHRPDHEISRLGRHKRFIRLHKHPSHILVRVPTFYLN
jgi:mediator of RNA polymerase II transcription subunit 14